MDGRRIRKKKVRLKAKTVTCRLDYQPLFGNEPTLTSEKTKRKAGPEEAAEIEPRIGSDRCGRDLKRFTNGECY